MHIPKTKLIILLATLLTVIGYIGVLYQPIKILHAISAPSPTSSIAPSPLAPQEPTPSSLPTPTPTPKEQQLSGFCQNVPILFYHHIEPLDLAKKEWHAQFTVDDKTFDSQMNYLVSSGYNIISPDTLVDALTNHKQLPTKSVAITIDDGYNDLYTYAFPIIKKYNLKVGLLIPTGLLENGSYVNWDQLKEMANSGKVSIYNHTWSHANIAALGKEKLQFEIETPKKQLADKLGVTNTIFGYPYGSISTSAIEALRTNGYTAALSTLPGTTQCDSFMMTLHRTRIGNMALSNYGL